MPLQRNLRHVQREALVQDALKLLHLGGAAAAARLERRDLLEEVRRRELLVVARNDHLSGNIQFAMRRRTQLHGARDGHLPGHGHGAYGMLSAHLRGLVEEHEVKLDLRVAEVPARRPGAECAAATNGTNGTATWL